MPTWIVEICRDLGSGIWALGKDKGRRTEENYSCTAFLPIPNFQFPIPYAGFTLLELTLVLFIIGLLVTVLLPRLSDLGSARLETSARRLAALVRYLNGEAAFSGRIHRIRYDLSEQVYAVQVLVPSRETNEFVLDSSPLSQTVSLPPGITFADIRVPTVGRVNSGQVYTHFYPHGYVDPTVIHLRDQQARVMTVLIPPITGEAHVYEGYVDGQH